MHENLNRRDFLKATGVGAAAVALPDVLSAKEKSCQRPNIIFFITDDQDKEMINAFGGKALTPNLDRLAKEGMKFTNAHMSSTVCTPSRYSCLTGRYAGRSYFKTYLEEYPPGSQGFPSFNVGLEQDNMNVGNILRQNGYATGYVGKFHVGPELKRPEEFKRYGLKYVDKGADPNDPKVSEAFKHNELWFREYIKKKGFSWAKHVYWGNLSSPMNSHNPEWTVDAALEFIEQNREGPFYLHYCTTLLHGGPNQWNKSMDEPKVSNEGILDEPPKVMPERKSVFSRIKAKGLDENTAGVTWLDDSVGAILDKLDELGIADNTLFVFLPDHGSNFKASLYDKDGTNVPCLMRWPGHIKAGTVCDELIQNIDFVPTFFDLAEAKVPDAYQVDGISLRPLFSGKKVKWRRDLYFEMGHARAVRTKEWKYIAVRYSAERIEKIRSASLEQLPRTLGYIESLGLSSRGMTKNPNYLHYDQLYNLKNDPLEQNNLAKHPEHQGRLRQMKELLLKYLKSFPGRPFGEFIPGKNAVPAGTIDDLIENMKKVRVTGKEVVVIGAEDDTSGKTEDRRQKTENRRRIEESHRRKTQGQRGQKGEEKDVSG